MTILEQILAGLQTKFSGVDAAILARIATKKAEGVTDAGQVPTIVEGISFSDVLTNYGDFRAGDASFKSVQNYEKKHNLKDGKPVETTTSPIPSSVSFMKAFYSKMMLRYCNRNRLLPPMPLWSQISAFMILPFRVAFRIVMNLSFPKNLPNSRFPRR